TEAKSACILGKSWFFNHQHVEGPACLIEGQPASVGEGIERAARILAEARYPIIYGLSDTTSEAQRVAVSIGDWIGGCGDTTTSVCPGPPGVAFQGVGGGARTPRGIKKPGGPVNLLGSHPARRPPRHLAQDTPA